MLQLNHIVKDYVTGDTTVRALKGIDLTFRKSEFVSILGPSGCGKTTLLNIVGGLDRYTSGDLLIGGKSTKDFKAYDWDAYRNSCVGFVFQSYNLIPHLSVLGNVEIALTLSGVSASERKRRATEALNKVGLSEQINKKPNQLSGGQMQRVAIARAIVNDPEIILADEPTGALDSKTSFQIMELLKEIASDRLIIMVTHNNELAEEYSTRIISLLDGEVISDTNPYSVEKERIDERFDEREQAERPAPAATEGLTDKQIAKLQKKQDRELARSKKKQLKKTSMAFTTAASLSGRNLITKKGRTFMTAFAGSIGIIGIALVLAVSNGFKIYIDKMQSDTLAGFPITVSQYSMDMESMTQSMGGSNKNELPEFPDDDRLVIYTPENKSVHYNPLTAEYVDYVKTLDSKHYNDITVSYSVQMNVLSKVESEGGASYKRIVTASKSSLMGQMTGMTTTSWQEVMPNQAFLDEQYQLIAGNYPTDKTELLLVVDKYNRISTTTLDELGIPMTANAKASLADMLGKELSVVLNDDWYTLNGKKFDDLSSINYPEAYENGLKLHITGILRIRESAPLSIYNNGILYSPSLTEYLIEDGMKSEIGMTQAASDNWNYLDNVPLLSITENGITYTKEQYKDILLQRVGASSTPWSISIFPKDFTAKKAITAHLDAYNKDITEDAHKILYMDAAALLSDTMGQMVDIISIALVAFAAVSLVVSSIMIGIITYVSVIERTKEIGVLRSIGARKKDISRVFNAETVLIGLCAGVIGVVVAFILTFPISAIIRVIGGTMITGNMAVLHPLHALLLIAVSCVLTFIAGLIPSGAAAKKDPVVALRSE